MAMKRLIALIFIFALLTACAPRYTINHDYPKEPISFPRDHAAHYDAQTEWWYYTGHIFDEDRNEYGFELTFFKRITSDDKSPLLKIPAYWIKDVGMVGHFAVTNVKGGTFDFGQKINLCSSWKADKDNYDVKIGDWSAKDIGGIHELKASMKDYEISLMLKPLKDPVPNGPGGIMAKGGGNGNYYYSITRIEVTGTLKENGKVKKVKGTAWMDHEYGTMKVVPGVKGWDWFSLQLNDGTDIMIYMIKDKNQVVKESGGTIVNTSGEYSWLTLSDIEIKDISTWQSQSTGANYPSQWEVYIKPLDLKLDLIPIVKDQELRLAPIYYWEGAVNIKGKRAGAPVMGKGYAELVGYSKSLKVGDKNLE
jgi:predicted secreted hydrolase